MNDTNRSLQIESIFAKERKEKKRKEKKRKKEPFCNCCKSALKFPGRIFWSKWIWATENQFDSGKFLQC